MDKKKALECYKKAADLNNSSAQFIVGSFYERGEDVEQNYELAVHYFEAAAAAGHPKAQNNLGTLSS